MKPSTPSSWMLRNNHRDQPPPDFHQSMSHQSPPLTSNSPEPSQPKKQQFNFHSVFSRNNKPARPLTPSASSLNSAYGAPSKSPGPNDHHLHPYSAMGPSPLPVVSSRSSIDLEDECPVCLEPLSFSFRLPGEKPHIVPECGHSLHEACFTAVYGPPPGQAKSSVPRKSNLGVCGVCRRPMKVGDGDSGKSNKLAALTGMGGPNMAPHYPGRDGAPSPSIQGRNHGQSTSQAFDPTQDDPLDYTPSIRSGELAATSYIVSPSIQVRPEFSSLTRSSETSQPLTCIVVIELPGKRPHNHTPGNPLSPDLYPARNGYPRQDVGQASYGSEPQRARLQQSLPPTPQERTPVTPSSNLVSPSISHDPRYPSSDGHDSVASAYSHQSHEEDPSSNPFSAITEDLRNRIIDWKGHPLQGLGPLQMYDLLSVRRDSLVREFFVYLFKEAIICVVEEKKRTFGRLLSNASGAAYAFTDSVSTGSSSTTQSKGVLRLRGRIYVRHIKQVTASSAAGEMSLTIDMEDERLDSFILIFKERSSLEAWKNKIQALVTSFQVAAARPPAPEAHGGELDIEEFGGSSKAMRVLSGSTSATVSTTDSLLNGSTRSTLSSSTSQGSGTRHPPPPPPQHKLSTLGEENQDEMREYDDTNPVIPHMSSGPSNSLTPLPHPALDLILVVSLPPPTALPSTAALKLRVIKATLDFILASLGPKDRLSLVTFEVGVGGNVRKTPFLRVGRSGGRARLARFVEETGLGRAGGEEWDGVDEFLVRGPKDEKTDVVTAVNHGLDVVLQRKARNPVSGLVLVSDAADSTRRAQMDLVLARAEAANVPIHSFGYGRSHDPASLWLMSNHTSGTYTFVKDWYDLRDCVAGCVGGMMSIGVLNMKLHMKIVDGQRFRIRKVSGGPSSIVASDGHNVDVDVGELRYGERKEMLVELELDNTEAQRSAYTHSANGRAMNATDQYVHSMGLDSLSLGDAPDIMDGMMDRMIDEVPVFEVDGAFFDPAAAKHVSRLSHPVLLTVTLLPLAVARAPAAPAPGSDPVIVRRRMELLASDMITRALVLVSRKNFPQAQKILSETKRILHTVLTAISKSLPAPSSNGGTVRNRKEILTLGAVRAMQAILQDLQILSEALEENVDLFAHDQRNFGAQQAMILRDQKSWSGRSSVERLFWTIDYAIELVSRSNDWVSRD